MNVSEPQTQKTSQDPLEFTGNWIIDESRLGKFLNSSNESDNDTNQIVDELDLIVRHIFKVEVSNNESLFRKVLKYSLKDQKTCQFNNPPLFLRICKLIVFKKDKIEITSQGELTLSQKGINELPKKDLAEELCLSEKSLPEFLKKPGVILEKDILRISLNLFFSDSEARDLIHQLITENQNSNLKKSQENSSLKANDSIKLEGERIIISKQKASQPKLYYLDKSGEEEPFSSFSEKDRHPLSTDDAETLRRYSGSAFTNAFGNDIFIYHKNPKVCAHVTKLFKELVKNHTGHTKEWNRILKKTLIQSFMRFAKLTSFGDFSIIKVEKGETRYKSIFTFQLSFLVEDFLRTHPNCIDKQALTSWESSKNSSYPIWDYLPFALNTLSPTRLVKIIFFQRKDVIEKQKI